MCNRALLLFGKLEQLNLHVNCHVKRTTSQSGLRFQTALCSLRVSCKRALTIGAAIIRSSRPVLLCKKRVYTNFAKFTRKDEIEIPAKFLSCEFCKISHNTFFKEHFGQLLQYKHSFCLLSSHDVSLFQKQCHTSFLAEYFFRLKLQAGNKSELNISNP